MDIIYLDYNATTPVAPAVREAMLPYLESQYGNASSSHALGRAAHQAVEQAREQVAALLEVAPEEIVFTSGGTEANNLAIKGVAFTHWDHKGHIVISALEHPAVVQPVEFLRRHGFEVSVVPCNADGWVDPNDVLAAIRDDTRLVSIMHANNEIGSVQSIAEISEICHDRGVLLHTDAAQSVGKVEVTVPHLGVDLLSVAGHKMYAPKGVGALYVRRGAKLEPVLHGAGHERGLRPGTENVPYIVALGQAAQLVREDLAADMDRMAYLRDQLWERLLAGVGPELTANAARTARLPNTLSVNFPRVVGQQLLAECPGLCASTGAACHSGQTKVSGVLRAIGLSPEVARGTVRLSVGRYTTEEEIHRAADMLLEAWERLAAQASNPPQPE